MGAQMMGDANSMDITRDQLRALAAHLDARRDAILQAWRDATEDATDLSIASFLSRSQFNDHVPGVLDAFAHKLRIWPEHADVEARQAAKEQGTEHGIQRWQQGYHLPELTREWGHLQRGLVEELESYAAAHADLEPDVMPTARRALADVCSDGINESVMQYWRLHQAEASGHVRDLERAVATLTELEQARAQAWREAAHDLRGSLSVVKGATSMLGKDDVPEPMRHEFFDLLHKGVSSLQEMLNDLMSLARLEAGQEQPEITSFDAAALLRDFCANAQPLAAERGLYLNSDGPETLEIQGDRAKIQRIAQNLLLNALKYTRQGGVTVIWEIDAERGTDRWMFCVQDTGPGLPSGPSAPLANKLHEATQSAHEVEERHQDAAAVHSAAPTVASQSRTLAPQQQPGEGVGLSIVKRLCELLDATLELETTAGTGSTFRVVLPRRYDNGAD